eukprot:CAMPEP_0201561816 /NCGR_PEP_ID=MMETSP0173_2-20130828/78996_1 /ASSEMBLY_ACC=CAM_ASM_000268 /TAXON_ID=218659 /ORGANISM="Vexillifera sp., Strain DIVA3 564/2" /LENGTH=657 /DNA_ID=CAMNT_0047976337 /DNA_START=268 /DNA_END=2241 /DNA_ORIENTATION=-
MAPPSSVDQHQQFELVISVLFSSLLHGIGLDGDEPKVGSEKRKYKAEEGKYKAENELPKLSDSTGPQPITFEKYPMLNERCEQLEFVPLFGLNEKISNVLFCSANDERGKIQQTLDAANTCVQNQSIASPYVFQVSDLPTPDSQSKESHKLTMLQTFHLSVQYIIHFLLNTSQTSLFTEKELQGLHGNNISVTFRFEPINDDDFSPQQRYTFSKFIDFRLVTPYHVEVIFRFDQLRPHLVQMDRRAGDRLKTFLQCHQIGMDDRSINKCCVGSVCTNALQMSDGGNVSSPTLVSNSLSVKPPSKQTHEYTSFQTNRKDNDNFSTTTTNQNDNNFSTTNQNDNLSSSSSSSSSSTKNLSPSTASSSRSPPPHQLIADLANEPLKRIAPSELSFFPEAVGAGQFGTVYKAKWRGMVVAVKQILVIENQDKEELAQQFFQEARMLKQLGTHPNVVSLLGVVDNPLSLVMPYLPNKSVDHLILNQPNKLTFRTALKIALSSARGMLHLHCESIIHRDVAIRNILLSSDLEGIIADFGLSRLKDVAKKYMKTVTAFGPVKQMAPEAIQSKKYSEKSDVYSFGIVMWCLAMKKLDPLEDEDPLDVAIAAKQGTPVPIPPIPSRKAPKFYRELAARCVQPEPDQRPNFHVIVKQLSVLSSILES